ncbi:ABA4-like family protein [Litoreibacter roseus]|uniref:DUF4281 domain-containing protein n=1 Tax=Litoreibacter roseus TaxID=2601869 RepID=A0A6N6JLX9_9RHOB|nr:ABA4-like family protein [Litoreibacter roseus]GFE67085.1 hypothetical protein KIN_41590 [Litoreibacter roseus]
MDPQTLFDVASTLAMLGWVALALSPLAPRRLLPVGGVVLPLLVCVIYALAAVLYLPGAEGGFDTLDNVMLLFSDRGATTVGWVHFLAFDLLVGGWIVRDARARSVPHITLLPCLFVTLMLGPVGLLAYLALRSLWVTWQKRKVAFA